MPYISSTLALLGAVDFASKENSGGGKGIITDTAEKIGGIEGARASRDAMSEAKGAQRDQIKRLEDKAIADQQNEIQRAQTNALRRQAKQGGGSPLGGAPAPLPVIKTLLGS